MFKVVLDQLLICKNISLAMTYQLLGLSQG